MNKKGVSMVLFVIAIAMILALVTAATTSYSTIINSTKLREYGNELNQIQKAVDEYRFLNNEYPVKEEYILDLSLIKEQSREEQFGKNEGTIEFYVVDLKKLGINELKRGINTSSGTLDFYAISKDNGKVYYLAGVKINKKWYYTLVDAIRIKLDI